MIIIHYYLGNSPHHIVPNVVPTVVFLIVSTTTLVYSRTRVVCELTDKVGCVNNQSKSKCHAWPHHCNQGF